MVWTHSIASLPLSSTAVQVRSMTSWIGSVGHVVGVTSSLKPMVGVASQLSTAVAVPVSDGVVEPQVTVVLPGQVSVGGVTSSTVTVA